MGVVSVSPVHQFPIRSPDGDDLGEAIYAQMIKLGASSTSAPASGSALSTAWCSMRRTSRRSSGYYGLRLRN